MVPAGKTECRLENATNHTYCICIVQYRKNTSAQMFRCWHNKHH